jgi:hypothetical protein
MQFGDLKPGQVETIVGQLFGKAEPGAGPDLARYPALTFAPAQWGEGVRLARNGDAADALADAAKLDGLVAAIDAFARKSGATWEEIFDAVRYDRDHPKGA